MPHVVNIDGISESLFLLQNLVHASPSFCRTHKILSGEEFREFDWNYYFGWLKSLVCDYMIQISTKLRILEDILKANVENIDFDKIDVNARKGLTIGNFNPSKKNLTLRESWNKIIHATDTQFDWIGDKSGFEYWSGCICLFGQKDGEDWKISLHVEQFALASSRYLDEIENEIDWYHLYKYDQ